MRKRDVFAVGMHFIEHYRRRAAEVGIPTVARQMRKQGVPPDIAALILAPQPITPERTPLCETDSSPC